MRIVKEAEERKNEILDVAEKLFFKKGFDQTSTNDILQEVGIARGTLYYHFKAKEEIMDAIIERYNKQIVNRAKELVANQSISIEGRMVQVIQAMNISQYTAHSEMMMEHIHKPQNIRMHLKIQKTVIQSITPVLAKLVEEGIESGLFHTQVPYECMEMMMIYATTLIDGELIELSDQEQFQRIKAMILNIEKMLGCKEGSLNRFEKMFFGAPIA